VPLVNELSKRFENVVLTQDWHPPGHRSFATSHPGTKPFDSIKLAYGEQVLWPDHCLQGSEALRFTRISPFRMRSSSSARLAQGVDSYSAFSTDQDARTLLSE